MSWFPTLWLCLAACGLSLTLATPSTKHSSALLGDKECLEGPSYWCQNFTTARQCNANQHCIRTVWEHQVLPADNGEICETCKKMVAQARDELKSNETQENIKLVLEGSCLILIPIKPLAHECVKLVDQAIPELIEALASQMNPQMVCATAGLCNSVRMDQLVALHKMPKKAELNCTNCQLVTGLVEANFRASSRDNVLNTLISLCGTLGSYSDGCAAAVIVHFNNLYENIAANMHPAGICNLGGVCHGFRTPHIEVPANAKLEGDMPCELCEQLVQHMRDVLVANTTEKEFEQVLLGICGQTHGFKKECVELVETYYPVIYAFLTQELDGNVICKEIGICPNNGVVRPLMPLLPVDVAATLQKNPSGLHRVPVVSSGVSVHTLPHPLQVAEAQLPLDSLVVIPQDKQLCQMCEYFLHFLQIEITNPVNEQVLIKKAEKFCNTLPKDFAPTCRSFVDTYSKALIALLAQDIDPSQVCPRIGVCPGFTGPVGCEPCKTTTNTLLSRVQGNTSVANVEKELMALCMALPFDDSRHCSQMMFDHREDLTDMVVAEFTHEEMCFYMKYCTAVPSPQAVSLIGNIETNEISQPNANEKVSSNFCELCEFVMKTLEKDLQNNKTEEEIRTAVEHVCYVMPHSVRPKCKQFIDQYCDLIVTLLAQSVSPDQICTILGVCSSSTNSFQYLQKSVSKCVVCESLMGALQGVMDDANVQRDVNHQLEMACLHLPRYMRRECQDMVRQLAPQIEVIMMEVPLGVLVCRRLNICGHTQAVDMAASDRCHEGEPYWCLSTMHAATCEKIEHCQKNVWFADKPSKKSNIRAKKFMF